MLGFGWLKRLRRKEAPPPSAARREPVDGFGLLFGSSGGGQHLRAASTVVIVGNCIAETMAPGLASVQEASKRFNFVAIPLHLKSLEDIESRRALANASHIFVQSVVAAQMETIRSASPPDAQIFLYPDVVFRSPWPFDHMSGFRDPAVEAMPHAIIRQHDSALARLREIIPDKKKRFQAYRDLNFEGASAIDRVIEAQKRFLEDIDKESDAFLGRFITRHFKERQLFYDSVHPSTILFQGLCEFAFRKLELPGHAPVIGGMDGWKAWAVPVHPLIARRLGLTWATESTRYTHGGLGAVTWEEWVKLYIETFG